MSHPQDLRGDLVSLQETHLSDKETLQIKRGWFSHLYHSKFSARARDPAILIHNSISFEPENITTDPNGRFVIVSGKLCNTQVVLASICAPNWDDKQFISRLFTSIPNVETCHIIIGKDISFVQDVDLDRSSTRPYSLTNSAKSLNAIAGELGLSDPWRCEFPDEIFFSHVHRVKECSCMWCRRNS